MRSKGHLTFYKHVFKRFLFFLFLPCSDESAPLPRPEHPDGHAQLLHVRLQLCPKVLVLGRVVHEDDLLEQRARRPVDDGVHCAEERRPRLVVEHDHDGRGRELSGVRLGLATGMER